VVHAGQRGVHSALGTRPSAGAPRPRLAVFQGGFAPRQRPSSTYRSNRGQAPPLHSAAGATPPAAVLWTSLRPQSMRSITHVNHCPRAQSTAYRTGSLTAPDETESPCPRQDHPNNAPCVPMSFPSGLRASNQVLQPAVKPIAAYPSDVLGDQAPWPTSGSVRNHRPAYRKGDCLGPRLAHARPRGQKRAGCGRSRPSRHPQDVHITNPRGLPAGINGNGLPFFARQQSDGSRSSLATSPRPDCRTLPRKRVDPHLCRSGPHRRTASASASARAINDRVDDRSHVDRASSTSTPPRATPPAAGRGTSPCAPQVDARPATVTSHCPKQATAYRPVSDDTKNGVAIREDHPNNVPGVPIFSRLASRVQTSTSQPGVRPFARDLPGFSVSAIVPQSASRNETIVPAYRKAMCCHGLGHGNTDWVKNVLAAGERRLALHSKDVHITNPTAGAGRGDGMGCRAGPGAGRRALGLGRPISPRSG